MDKARVTEIRDRFKALKFTMWNRGTGESKEFTPYLHICCDNSLNVTDFGNNVIWDDSNEIFYWLKANTASSIPYITNLTHGDVVKWPYQVIAVDYDEIQNMRMSMNQEVFDQFMSGLGGKVPENLKEEFEDTILSQSDVRNVLVAKRDTSYNTMRSKKYDP